MFHSRAYEKKKKKPLVLRAKFQQTTNWLQIYFFFYLLYFTENKILLFHENYDYFLRVFAWNGQMSFPETGQGNFPRCLKNLSSK